MRSAALFLALLAAGVLIALLFIWSDDSLLVLTASIVALFTLFALFEFRPWEKRFGSRSATKREALDETTNDADEKDAGHSTRVRHQTTDTPSSNTLSSDALGSDALGSDAPSADIDPTVPDSPTATNSFLRQMPTVGGGSATATGSRIQRFDERPVDERPGDDGDGDTERARTQIWRVKFDATSDDRGLSGVPVGGRRLHHWSWSQIEDIGADLCEEMAGTKPASRLALQLDLSSPLAPGQSTVAYVGFGPHQQPDDVIDDAFEAWRSSKIPQSRVYELSAEEQLTMLADHFGAAEVIGHGWSSRIGIDTNDPGLMLDTVCDELEEGGALCRVDHRVEPDELLDLFDTLFQVRALDVLLQTEADDIETAVGDRTGFPLVQAAHRSFEWIAEDRDHHPAYIDRGGADYLVGLVPLEVADDWDGQTVGDGMGWVTLRPPT